MERVGMKAVKTQVKICGLTREEEVGWVVEEQADYFGVVLFFPKSRRNNSIENARKLLAVSQAECEKRRREEENFTAPVTVAVTVSPTPEQIKEIEDAGFDMIQIHGTLSEETLAAASIPIIRAFSADEMETCHTYDDCPKIAAYLFDAQTPGSGIAFDWTRLSALLEKNAAADGRRLFLAGGLNCGNVKEAVRKIHPDAVDVSSGVEKDTAAADGAVIKDREKIKEFIRKVRADEQ